MQSKPPLNLLCVRLGPVLSLDAVPRPRTSSVFPPLIEEARKLESNGLFVQAAEAMHRGLLLAQHSTYPPASLSDSLSAARNQTFTQVLTNWIAHNLAQRNLPAASGLLNVLASASGSLSKLVLKDAGKVQRKLRLLEIWLHVEKEDWLSAEGAVRKAKEMKAGGLWEAEVRSMECLALISQKSKYAGKRVRELETLLTKSRKPASKPWEVLMTVCRAHLSYLNCQGRADHSSRCDESSRKRHLSGFLTSRSEAALPGIPPISADHHASALHFANMVFKARLDPVKVHRGRRHSDAYSVIEKVLKSPQPPTYRLRLVLRKNEAPSEPTRRELLSVPKDLCRRTVTMQWKRLVQLALSHSAAAAIQRQWRVVSARKHSAARLIQTHYRIWITSQRIASEVLFVNVARRAVLKRLSTGLTALGKNVALERSASCIQSWFRQKLAMVVLWEECETQKRSESISIYSASMSTKPETTGYSFSESRLDFGQETDRSVRKDEKRVQSAVTIQTAFRRYACQSAFHSVKAVVVRLQAWVRSVLGKAKYRRLKAAACTVQKAYRGHVWHKSPKQKAAARIQAVYRGYRTRRALLLQQQSAALIQRFCRRRRPRSLLS